MIYHDLMSLTLCNDEWQKKKHCKDTGKSKFSSVAAIFRSNVKLADTGICDMNQEIGK